MSDIALNFDPLVYGAVIALAVAGIGTPLAWRLTAGLPRLRRAVLASIACVGLAGLASLPVAFSALRLEGTTLSAVASAAILQLLLLPVLLLIPTKS